MAGNQTVFKAALAMPKRDRVRLVERLLDTLSPAERKQQEDDFALELDRRRRQFREDPSCRLSLKEFFEAE
jgi:putative addiction module component (TIGR02574 family)